MSILRVPKAAFLLAGVLVLVAETAFAQGVPVTTGGIPGGGIYPGLIPGQVPGMVPGTIPGMVPGMPGGVFPYSPAGGAVSGVVPPSGGGPNPNQANNSRQFNQTTPQGFSPGTIPIVTSFGQYGGLATAQGGGSGLVPPGVSLSASLNPPFALPPGMQGAGGGAGGMPGYAGLGGGPFGPGFGGVGGGPFGPGIGIPYGTPGFSGTGFPGMPGTGIRPFAVP